MLPAPPNSPTRRKRCLYRWFIAFIAAMLAYGAWTEYAFRSALQQANALGWAVSYIDPVEVIQVDWRNAFKKETWLDGVTAVVIPKIKEGDQCRVIMHRLNPKLLPIAIHGATSALRMSGELS